MTIEFAAPEYQADGSFRVTAYAFEGTSDQGWAVKREGRPHLALGPGYRLLRSAACGVCATDLARRFLPFPLPQILGHEVLAVDDDGGRHVVEINASHATRGVDTPCPFCQSCLAIHCPQRLVVGIHDLPGGFGPYLLAPVNAVFPVPDAIPSSSAVLIEPLAAALHAVTKVNPRDGDCIAVLGPRRLGMLVLAALRAYRSTRQLKFKIMALARRRELLDVAAEFGADTGLVVEGGGEGLPDGLADVVIDTTGTPEGFALALRLARREVHLKSTHGRPAAGLQHLTQLVVDEIMIGRFEPQDIADRTVAWLASDPPPSEVAARRLLCGEAATLLAELEGMPAASGLPRADAVVVDSVEQIDRAIRPRDGQAASLVRPRGTVLVRPNADAQRASALVEAVVDRGLTLTSSRCGDFKAALALMMGDPELGRVGDRLITHRFPANRIAEAFETAASPACLKAIIEQDITV